MRRHSLLISSLLDSAPSAHDDPAHSDRVPKIFQVEFVIHAHVGTCLPIREILRGAIEICAPYIDVRGMRPAPGTERAAYCEEGYWEGDEPVPHRQLAIKDFLR